MDNYVAREVGGDIIKSIDNLTSVICDFAIVTQASLTELNLALTEIKEDVAYIREMS